MGQCLQPGVSVSVFREELQASDCGQHIGWILRRGLFQSSALQRFVNLSTKNAIYLFSEKYT